MLKNIALAGIFIFVLFSCKQEDAKTLQINGVVKNNPVRQVVYLLADLNK